MSNTQPPPALPGFEHIRRRWDAAFEAFTCRILPGEYYVTKQDEGISTTLGSCVAACIRDRTRGVGGMNHFMLPSDGADAEALRATNLSDAARYGNYAMEHLINDILRNGGQRRNLEVKLFGGGRIMANMTDIGAQNVLFVRDYLSTEGLEVVAEDVGDVFPRKVIFFPATGRVRVKRLRSLHNNVIADQERHYIDSIKKQPIAGAIELF